MLTKAEIEERLNSERNWDGCLKSETLDGRLHIEALETAQRLAEWLGALAVFPDDEVAYMEGESPWLYVDRSLLGEEAIQYDSATKAARAWLGAGMSFDEGDVELQFDPVTGLYWRVRQVDLTDRAIQAFAEWQAAPWWKRVAVDVSEKRYPTWVMDRVKGYKTGNAVERVDAAIREWQTLPWWKRVVEWLKFSRGGHDG